MAKERSGWRPSQTRHVSVRILGVEHEESSEPRPPMPRPWRFPFRIVDFRGSKESRERRVALTEVRQRLSAQKALLNDALLVLGHRIMEGPQVPSSMVALVEEVKRTRSLGQGLT